MRKLTLEPKDQSNEFITLVDENDTQWGKIEKIQAHEKGLLHRAFSIFIFNSKGELLLQQRSPNKYHSGNLWTNTCCSHPSFGESLASAANRRLMEEMGFDCSLTYGFNFIYKASFDNGLIEHEFDHVFFGKSDELPIPNANEVKDWKYMSLSELTIDIDRNPDRYTAWLKICFPKVLAYVQQDDIHSIAS